MSDNPTDEELLGDIYEDQALPSTPALDEETPFATMMSSFDDAAQSLGIDPGEYRILRKCDREIAFSVPVRLDDGSMEVLEGFRIAEPAQRLSYHGEAARLARELVARDTLAEGLQPALERVLSIHRPGQKNTVDGAVGFRGCEVRRQLLKRRR